jgi:hypothetical protein
MADASGGLGNKKINDMGKINKFGAYLVFSVLSLLGFSTAFADTIVTASNRIMTGTVIQTNGEDVLILTRFAAFNFSAANIKEIKTEPVDAIESSSTNKLPDFQKAIVFLSKQPWAKNLTPIPATVITKGILRNVPYTSFRCANDYEVNIYGDLENPAGIEIGIYRKLLNDSSAKSNCLKFITDLLAQSEDKEIVQGLNLNKDLKTLNELTFEITPPTDEDAYDGWWISVYSEKQLNAARASDEEMGLISMTQADAAKDARESTNSASWSVDDLKRARPADKTTISFVNTSGELITNAEVVRVIDGVSLIWRNGPASSGMIKLADLPEDLRVRFGYDAAKTKAADDLAKANKERWQQEADAATASAQPANAIEDTLGDAFSSYESRNYSGRRHSGVEYSGGGSVYVHGYTRRDGTYVNAYTRSYPSR